VRGGGKYAHIGAGFGDEHISDDLGPPRDADQQFPGEAKGFDRLLEAFIETGDVGAVGIDAVQVQPHHKRVMVIESAAQRLSELRDLLAHPCFGQIGEHRRIALPGDECFEHRPPRDSDDL